MGKNGRKDTLDSKFQADTDSKVCVKRKLVCVNRISNAFPLQLVGVAVRGEILNAHLTLLVSTIFRFAVNHFTIQYIVCGAHLEIPRGEISVRFERGIVFLSQLLVGKRKSVWQSEITFKNPLSIIIVIVALLSINPHGQRWTNWGRHQVNGVLQPQNQSLNRIGLNLENSFENRDVFDQFKELRTKYELSLQASRGQFC